MGLPSWFVCTAFLSLALWAGTSNSVAVMSVDLGAEWMKVAVVTPGVPMEIALNRESKRKTATAVSLRGDERTFGSDAVSTGVRFPKTCYVYLLDLLGKPFDHPQVKRYQERFPYYDMKPHPERGTVVFQHDEDTVYTVEELMAMILEHAKSIGEEYTEQKIKDAVLTVPVYFGQSERRALLDAAELAGVNVLQLISEPMAVALNYGMFRRKEVNGTAKYLMFYDMGSQDTTVSIVLFQTIKTKERGYSETHPHAHILGIGYERNLGGTDLQVSLREYLADEFNALKKTKTDVRSVPRAMGKLFKEAGRVKTVLSANTNTYAQVENVMEDIDFRHEVTREKLLELNQDYFARVTRPIDEALLAAGMTLEEVSEIILVGAGTRVPKVQELLTAHLGRELGKNLNTDEAAAMGAVYKAADLSTGFKVKKFVTKEGVVLPIDVDFTREYVDDETGEQVTKEVKRSLFSKMNLFPQKKIMTFNKHVGDFTFRVNHNELEYLGDEVNNLGPLNLTEVDVKGVAAALDKYAAEPNVEAKGVKAHFALDDSGMINVTSVESTFERTITVEEQEANEKKEEEEKKSSGEAKEGDEEKKEDGSWANLGDTISSFFNKDEKKDGDDKDAKDGKDKKDKKKDDKKKDDKKKEEKEKEEKKKEPKKPKIETLKEPLEFAVRIVDVQRPSERLLKESAEKLKALNDRDELKKKRETALNALESFVIDVRDKMYQEIYEESSTEEERETISAKCSEISDWIDEEVTPETELKDLDDRLKQLKELTSSWFARVREHNDRPEALAGFDQMMNSSSKFLEKARNKTGDDGYFTVAEVDALGEKIDAAQKWKEEALEAQEKQPKSEMPKMTTSLIAEKALDVDREVKYLLNKFKVAKAEKDKERAKKEAEEKAAKEAEEKQKKKDAKKKKKDANATEEAEAPISPADELDDVKLDEGRDEENKSQGETETVPDEESPKESDDGKESAKAPEAEGDDGGVEEESASEEKEEADSEKAAESNGADEVPLPGEEGAEAEKDEEKESEPHEEL